MGIFAFFCLFDVISSSFLVFANLFSLSLYEALFHCISAPNIEVFGKDCWKMRFGIRPGGTDNRELCDEVRRSEVVRDMNGQPS